MIETNNTHESGGPVFHAVDAIKRRENIKLAIRKIYLIRESVFEYFLQLHDQRYICLLLP